MCFPPIFDVPWQLEFAELKAAAKSICEVATREAKATERRLVKQLTQKRDLASGAQLEVKKLLEEDERKEQEAASAAAAAAAQAMEEEEKAQAAAEAKQRAKQAKEAAQTRDFEERINARRRQSIRTSMSDGLW